MKFCGMRVFYKGIELERKYMEESIELLEFIDIKGELDGSYINISRGGFTEKGERYFDEHLYPGLLDAVKTVLLYLEKQAEEGKENNIKKKIENLLLVSAESMISLNILMNSGNTLQIIIRNKNFLQKVLTVLEKIMIDGGIGSQQIAINIKGCNISGNAKVLDD